MTGGSLLGRAREFERLNEVLNAAREGRGRVVVVAGELGSGKSALLDAAAGLATTAGFTVLSSRGLPSSAPGPWLGTAAAVRALTTRPPSGPPSLVWNDVLAALAARGAVLWLVDDAHALDAESAGLLRFLSSTIGALPVVLLLAQPTDGGVTVAGPALTLALGGLAPADARALVTLVSGRGDDEPVAAVVARAGGNPFFLVECARALAAGRAGVPESVTLAVEASVQRLPDATTATLRALAVLGADARLGVVAGMRGVTTGRTLDELAPALRAGLAQEDEPGCFRLAHAVVGEVLLASASAAQRVALHRAAAAALTLLGSGLAVQLARARQLLAALRAGDDAPSVPSVLAAVDAAEAAGDLPSALGLLDELLRARSVGLLPPASAAELTRAARLAASAGAFAKSRAWADAALDLAHAAGDLADEAEAALALGLDTRAAQRDAGLIAALERVFARRHALPTPVALRVQARLAAARQPSLDPSADVALARDALARARAELTGPALGDVLFSAGAALSDFVPRGEEREVAQALLEHALAAEERPRALRACARLAIASGELGDVTAMDAAVERALALSQDCLPALRWRPLMLGAMRALARGALEQADRLVVEVEQLGALTDDRALPVSVWTHRLLRHGALSVEPPTDAVLQALTDSADAMGISRVIASVLRAVVLGRGQDAARARQELAPLPVELLERTRLLTSFPTVAEAFALAGTAAARAQVLAALARSRARHCFSGHVAFTYEGPTARLQGLLHESLGQTDAALASLRQAVDDAASLGFTLWVARCRAELARAALRLGAPGALALEREATEALDALGPGHGLHALLPRADVAAPAPATPVEPLRLLREGDVFRVRWADVALAVPASRGLELLARLVERAGDEVHVLTLSSDGDAALGDSSAGPKLDDAAVQAYRRRLDALAQALQVARLSQPAQVPALETEKRWLEAELAGAAGLAGRPRLVGSLAERARVNTQRRLKDAVAKLAQLSPRLGEHLARSLRTGTYCVYRP